MFQNRKKLVGLCLIVFTLLLVSSPPFQQFASLPNEIRLFEGMSSPFSLTFPTVADVESDHPDIVGVATGEPENVSAERTIHAFKAGQAELMVKLGQIPLKKVKVDVLPDVKVYPGGQSIGVKLNAAGALVVGHHFIEDHQKKVSPGEKADIQVGDMIVEMNDVKIKNLDQIGKIVDEAGENGDTLDIKLVRGKETKQVSLEPVYDKKEERYRLGLYIRNSAAGVGTLTFIHPESQAYGALGHVISDVDTQKPIIVGDGKIVDSNVSSIEKGTRGAPGEKFSSLDESKTLGKVTKNTPFGIFGHMEKPVKNGVIDEPIPIGLSEDVREGPAEILTVVNGQKVEKFAIEVVDIVEQKFPATKGLVIKVTDERLLKETGGIVQGMSGSPIIQDGKLIGAVTHVFVNDPTSGYGCFIEWMLQDADIPLQPEQKPKAS